PRCSARTVHLLFFFQCADAHRSLHSFPTRRSSDLNGNLRAVGVPAYSGGVEVKHLLWLIAEGEGYELLKQVAHKGLKGLKVAPRSEEHTSELQSRGHLVCRLLLEKKKKQRNTSYRN